MHKGYKPFFYGPVALFAHIINFGMHNSTYMHKWGIMIKHLWAKVVWGNMIHVYSLLNSEMRFMLVEDILSHTVNIRVTFVPTTQGARASAAMVLTHLFLDSSALTPDRLNVALCNCMPFMLMVWNHTTQKRGFWQWKQTDEQTIKAAINV